MQKICEICGEEYEAKRKDQRFCSVPHKVQCSVCEKEFEIEKRSWLHNYVKTGKVSCSKECRNIERKRTCFEQYGVESVTQLDEVKKKAEATSLKKYGTKSPNQADAVKAKKKESSLERYGVESPTQLPSVKAKVRQTNLERRGVEWTSQDPKVRAKQAATNLKRYGSVSPLANEVVRAKGRETNLTRLGVEFPTQNSEVRAKVLATNLERYGINYVFCRPDVIEKAFLSAAEKNGPSVPEQKFSELLSFQNVDHKQQWFLHGKGVTYAYDFLVGDTFIEINPWVYHNSTRCPGRAIPKDKKYHLEKTLCAEQNGYRCIHVWDWDDIEKIARSLIPRRKLYARSLTLSLNSDKKDLLEVSNFLDEFHFQSNTKGTKVAVVLRYHDEIIQVMTFGTARYAKEFDWELLRLCTRPGYKVAYGAQRLLKAFRKGYPGSIVSYCDRSKFKGDVYGSLGFAKNRIAEPRLHWYEPKIRKHILDSSLVKQGADRLIGTNYGKGTDNRQILLDHGFVKIYDCGQDRWELV